jgi:hypothetical protein
MARWRQAVEWRLPTERSEGRQPSRDLEARRRVGWSGRKCCLYLPGKELTITGCFWLFAGWDLHLLDSAALSRRTPQADI